LASMLRAARDGSRVLFFSLEMTAQAFANRVIADLCYDPRQPIAYLRAHQVIEVDQKAILMVARTGSRLRAYRGEIDPDVVLAWQIGQDVL
jgi:hypothetical protein